jgi:uncharacterized protein (DUF1330 family)
MHQHYSRTAVARVSGGGGTARTTVPRPLSRGWRRQGEVLEGSLEGRSLVVFEFQSMEAMHSFWDSPEYAEVKKLRQGSAELDVWAVPGVEVVP